MSVRHVRTEYVQSEPATIKPPANEPAADSLLRAGNGNSTTNVFGTMVSDR
jgi:hypothetical protein